MENLVSRRDRQSPSSPVASLEYIVGSRACHACRARVTKCSTERPQCQECGKRGTTCLYPAAPSNSMASLTKSTKRKLGQMKLQSHDAGAFEQVYCLLQSQPQDVAAKVFQRIRGGADVQAIMRFIQYGSLRVQLSLVPDASYQFASPFLADMMPVFKDPNNPYLESKLYDSLATDSAHRLPNIQEPSREGIYHIPFSGARIYDIHISSDILNPSRWTSISSDDSFLRSLVETYFLYEFPFWPCFNKDIFLEDMISGRKDYCSPLLVNVVLTASCHGMHAMQHRAEFWNPRTYSYQFMAETRRLWELEQAQTPCRLTTIQAATILGRIYFANGMDKLGWVIWAQALAMAEQLDLFSAPMDSHSDKERISRTITAWGLFSQQSFSCFYLMKPPLIRKPPQAPLPDFQHASDFFGEIWIRYPLAQRPVPVDLGPTFLALIHLRTIMNDIAGDALLDSSGSNNLTLERAKAYNTTLTAWYGQLPVGLQPKNVVLPTHLQLHMQYHNLVTMTFLPFLSAETSFNRPDDSTAFIDYTGFSPAKIISSSKACLETLLHMFYHRHGFEAYYIFLLQVLVQLGFDAAGQLGNPAVEQTRSPAALKATRATLILCAKGMRDQGRNFYLSECVFRILRDTMTDRDVSLLRDWAQDKGEDERERLMTEHVHGEYPVNIEAITQDPSERRLHRLLETLGDIKSSGAKLSPEGDDMASRTWRSIVF